MECGSADWLSCLKKGFLVSLWYDAVGSFEIVACASEIFCEGESLGGIGFGSSREAGASALGWKVSGADIAADFAASSSSEESSSPSCSSCDWS